jgi:hypothetical protein
LILVVCPVIVGTVLLAIEYRSGLFLAAGIDGEPRTGHVPSEESDQVNEEAPSRAQTTLMKFDEFGQSRMSLDGALEVHYQSVDTRLPAATLRMKSPGFLAVERELKLGEEVVYEGEHRYTVRLTDFEMHTWKHTLHLEFILPADIEVVVERN